MEKIKLNELMLSIKNKSPFAFSRFGDGEWLNIRKVKGQNCDGNIYFPDLGDRLKDIVSNKQDYYIGAQPTKHNLPTDVNVYTANYYHNSDVFHEANIDNTLKPIFKILHQSHIVYIGNNSMRKLDFIDEFIEIPYKNVWLHYDSVLQSIKDTFDNKHKVYLFSAGMCANVFIHDLWQINKSNTYIDIGSAFDPYVGRKTRNYHFKLKI